MKPFRRHVNGMPDMGQGEGWTERQWRKASIKTIQLTCLISTNLDGYLDYRRVARYLKSGKRGEPFVVEHDKKFYVADGHHRVVAAYQRGETYIRARVMRIG